MRVTYGLLKEHVEAVEKGLEGVDPELNPLIDPRSVRFKTIPQPNARPLQANNHIYKSSVLTTECTMQLNPTNSSKLESYRNCPRKYSNNFEGKFRPK